MRREARSLNLSNSVAILTYEALRQNGLPGLTGTGRCGISTFFIKESTDMNYNKRPSWM